LAKSKTTIKNKGKTNVCVYPFLISIKIPN